MMYGVEPTKVLLHQLFMSKKFIPPEQQFHFICKGQSQFFQEKKSRYSFETHRTGHHFQIKHCPYFPYDDNVGKGSQQCSAATTEVSQASVKALMFDLKIRILMDSHQPDC